MKPRTIILFCVPKPDQNGRMSQKAMDLIRRRLEEIPQHLKDKTVRIFASPHPHARATGGIIAQTLRVGQVETITQIKRADIDQSKAAADQLFSEPLHELRNRAESVIIVADRINVSKLAVACARTAFGLSLEEVSLCDCQLRVVRNELPRDTIIPKPRERISRYSLSPWQRDEPYRR